MRPQNTLVGLIALLAALCASPAAQAQSKIAVVDMQRALNETEDGRKAKAKLKRLFQKRQKTLDKQQEELKAMKLSLEKQKDVLSREVLSRKLATYQKAFAELQTTYMDFQKELAAKEGELTKDIIAKMQQILRRIGQKEGYALVLERGEAGVIYIPSNYDLTDLVIQRYNSGEGKKSSGSGKKKKKKKK